LAELRINPVTGERVILSPRRAARPADLARPGDAQGGGRGLEAGCPFCPGNEAETPLEVMVRAPEGRLPDQPGWLLRVVPNLYPALEPGKRTGDGTASREPGLLQSSPVAGFHEVIIHSPDHHAGLAELDAQGVARVMEAYRDRVLAHRREPGIGYVQVILNHGGGSGASLSHSHSQVFALPFVPSRVELEMRRARAWRRRGGGCLFCELIEAERRGERLVLDEGGFIAFCAFAPRFPFETWLLPRAHASRFEGSDDAGLEALGEALRHLLGSVFRGLGDPPYNLYLHTSPCYAKASHPYYHWHFELLPRLAEWGGFEMASDTVICTVPPEEAAGLLRSRL